MFNKKFHIKAHEYLPMAIAFCLPFGRLTPVFIILLMLNFLIGGELKSKFAILAKSKCFWLFTSLYFIHIAGLAFTHYIDQGLFDLEVKLSLLVFPVIFAARPLSGENINRVFKAFVAGGVISSLFLLARAAYFFFSAGENRFFYEAFSVLVHTSYVSMYFNLLMAWIILGLLKRGTIRASYTLSVSWLLLFFFTVVNVLLFSKMGMISMMLMFFCFGAYYVVLSRRYVAGAAAALLFMSGLFIASVKVPIIKSRVDFAVAAFTKDTIDITSNESSEVRMLVWRAANDIISDHFFTGVGTGDTKPMLLRAYASKGMKGAFEHRLNAHNEFYQVFLTVGVFGFIILVACVLVPLVIALRKRFLIYLIFLILIILNFIPESMLETQAGVMFYAFVNSMLFFYVVKDNTGEKIPD
ncbi:MAG TPA: O-antigen ligase family protein [Bacteroidia bacterium]|jgi:O-antigen ligase